MLEEAAVEIAPLAGSRPERVVIVMPAYNAARTIADAVRAIPAGYYDEIVVVDDHSGDDTVDYGLGTLWTASRFLLHRWGLAPSDKLKP